MDEETEKSLSMHLRTILGVLCWSSQILIGAAALYFKVTQNMMVIVTFLLGVPLGVVFAVSGWF